MNMTNNITVELIFTPLKKNTFEVPKIKKWVESNSYGKCLNLFSGDTKLNIDEIRNDIDVTKLADYHLDAVEFVKNYQGSTFDTIILDPPYSYRKAMELYKGNYSSRFKLLADNLSKIISDDGRVISFGYHSTFMGKIRKFKLSKLCVFAHGGAQHCTIAIIEKRDY